MVWLKRRYLAARASIAVWIACYVLPCAIASAQVQLDRFFPPAVGIGGEAVVKAEGKFPSWPVAIDVDRDDVSVEVSEDSGSLKVVVNGDATPGVAWIRMRDADSASSLVPLLIEPLVVTEEVEPNDKIDEAMKVELPCILAGRLAKSGDVDVYRFSVRSGQTITLSVLANQLLQSPMDAVAQLVDESGNVLLQIDDRRGLDPQIVYRVQQDRTLCLRLFAFPETPNSTIGYAGAASFVYLVRLTNEAFVDHILPLSEPNDDEVSGMDGWNLAEDAKVQVAPATGFSPRVAFVPGALGWQWQLSRPDEAKHQFESDDEEVVPSVDKLPVFFSGRLKRSGEVDRLRFPVKKGTRYRIAVDSRRFGFLLDSVLRLVNPDDGSELARNDDESRNQFDAALEYSAKADGVIELQISDLVDGYGMRHAYTTLIQEAPRNVAMTVAADHFALAAGASVEIPVVISRRGGFGSKLLVKADRLPPEVTCEPVESDGKGDTAKNVTLKLIAKEGVASSQGAFRITAQTMDDADGLSDELFYATYPLRDLVNLDEFWLSVSANKEK